MRLALVIAACSVLACGCQRRDRATITRTHEVVESVEPARGEPPLEELTTIPAPPVISTTPAIGAHVDRWVQLRATLTSVSPAGEGALRLSDGGRVRVERVHAPTWSPHVGKSVTVTGRLFLDKGSAGALVDLVIRGPTAICAGAVSRCGM